MFPKWRVDPKKGTNGTYDPITNINLLIRKYISTIEKPPEPQTTIDFRFFSITLNMFFSPGPTPPRSGGSFFLLLHSGTSVFETSVGGEKDHPLSISGIYVYTYIYIIYIPYPNTCWSFEKKPRKTYRKQKTPNLRRYLLDVYAGDTNIYIKPTSKPNRSMKKRIQVGGKHSLKFQPSLPETNSKSTWKWTPGKGDSYWKPSFLGASCQFQGGYIMYIPGKHIGICTTFF